MEIPKIIQKAYEEVLKTNSSMGCGWVKPILELSTEPEHLEIFFRVRLKKARSIFDSLNTDICNVNKKGGEQ